MINRESHILEIFSAILFRKKITKIISNIFNLIKFFYSLFPYLSFLSFIFLGSYIILIAPYFILLDIFHFHPPLLYSAHILLQYSYKYFRHINTTCQHHHQHHDHQHKTIFALLHCTASTLSIHSIHICR